MYRITTGKVVRYSFKESETNLMARIPMVTRTISAIKVNAFVVNLDTKEVATVEITIPNKKYTDTQKEKAIQKALSEVGNYKFCNIDNEEIIEELRGMTEAKFIAESEPYTRSTKEETDEN